MGDFSFGPIFWLMAIGFIIGGSTMLGLGLYMVIQLIQR